MSRRACRCARRCRQLCFIPGRSIEAVRRLATGRTDALRAAAAQVIEWQSRTVPGRWPAAQVGTKARCGRDSTLGIGRRRARAPEGCPLKSKTQASFARAPFAHPLGVTPARRPCVPLARKGLHASHAATAAEFENARARAVPAQGDAAEEAEIVGRLLASAMGLPRVCVFKVCRRRKRCFGPHLACFEHHRGLAKKRMAAAIALIAKPLKGPR